MILLLNQYWWAWTNDGNILKMNASTGTNFVALLFLIKKFPKHVLFLIQLLCVWLYSVESAGIFYFISIYSHWGNRFIYHRYVSVLPQVTTKARSCDE